MISPELLRRYPFFGGLSHDQLLLLAKAGDEITAEEGHYFFKEGDNLHYFYLVLEGAVAIVFQVPTKEAAKDVAGQLTREMETRDIVVSTIGTGDVFAWSGLIPPYKATASAKAIMPCRVVAFDCSKLLEEFEKDCRFGYLMVQKAAQIIRQRVRDLRVESLTWVD